MSLIQRLLIALPLATAAAYMATPYAIGIANRLKFYDVPAGYKGHRQPTPYLGGSAVTAAFVITLTLVAGHWGRTLPTIFGVAVLWAVGTVDDRRTVPPGARVAIELALATLLWAVGLGWSLHAGPLVDLAVTGAWTVAVINAFNLFDNMDGAASTMALVACAGTAVLGALAGHAWVSVGAVALAGACLGFLPRNISQPARVFLGDGGSMPVGFAVAVLAMRAATISTPGWPALLVGVLLVGIPALDTCLVVVSRRRRGLSVLTGGRDHLTHRTRLVLPSARHVALALGAAQAVVSTLAVLASRGGTSFIVVAAVVYALTAACAIGLLERHTAGALDLWSQGAGERPPAQVDSSQAQPDPMPESGSGDLALVGVGIGAGLSPFFFSYYDASTWVPIGLAMTVLAAVAVVARPGRLEGPARLALTGAMGLGVWALLSTAWAESVENAVVEGNRWLAYGALLLLLAVLVRTRRRAILLLAAATVGVLTVALSVLARLLGGDPAALFLGGRLNTPLGYINGEGCLFVMGLWLCMAAAEGRPRLLAAAGAGSATLMGCLALLSQSRGTALAMLASLIAVVAFVPRRTRRVYGLLVIGGAVGLAAPALLQVYSAADGGAIGVDVAHAAGRAALLASLGACLTWGLLGAVWDRTVLRPRAAPRLRQAGAWALAAPVVVALSLGAGHGHRIQREAGAQWRAFTHLAPSGSSGSTAAGVDSHLLSGAGNRYDYWRIAWGISKEHPLAGVGAGNYVRDYFKRRATSEDVQQPHSIELQMLSELGLVGIALLGLLLAGGVWGVVRSRGPANRQRDVRLTLVAGLGAFVAWLTQASVDWMHLLPGLTALALSALAVLLMPSRPIPAGRHPGPRSLDAPSRARRLRALAAAAIFGTLVIAGASLSRQALAEALRARAQKELARAPASAIAEANRSLQIDGDAMASYYVKAAALARLDRGPAAEAALRAALAREPDNFVTWTLLGDVAVREGDRVAAERDYKRAHRLDPRDGALARALAASHG